MAVSKKAVPWGSILLFAGAEEAAIWFLAGEEVLFQYGVAAGVLTIVCAGAVFLLRGKHQPPYSGEWMDYPRKEPLCEDWNLTIEEEAEEKKKEEIVSKENQEIETVLLAEKKDGQKLAFLESVSRERESIEVPYIPFVIGKHEELADYCLRHPTVSRLHIRLDQKEGVFIVTDLNSTNGTIVDQYHLQSNETVSIKNGDRLCLADLEYRFWEK